MVRIYTLTLAPLDSATITHKFIPKENCAVPHRCSNPVAAASTRPPLPILEHCHSDLPAGGATGEHLVSLLAHENVPVATVEAKDWTRQNLHVHVEASGEQYRFVMRARH